MSTLQPDEQLCILIRKDVTNVIGDRIPNYNFKAVGISNDLPVGKQNWVVSINFKIVGNENIQCLTAVEEHLAEVGESLVVDYNALLRLQGTIERFNLLLSPFKQEKAPLQRL